MKSYEDTTEKLMDIEAQILRKRNELRQFESEYRKVLTAVFLAADYFHYHHFCKEIWVYDTFMQYLFVTN